MTQVSREQVVQALLAAIGTDFKVRSEDEKALIHQYRSQFVRGKQFRCLVPVKLWGMQPAGPGVQRGWSAVMPEGTVLTCAGESMTFGDGVPAVKWLDENGKHIANDCLVRDVVGGMWGGQLPRPGLLEVVE